MFLNDPILPEDPDGLEVLHDREYRVRAFRMSDDRLLIRGAVRDQKPPGMYVPDDDQPLTMHHMVVEIEIEFPSLLIAAARAVLDVHPHTECSRIEDHYQHLVGLSIARGFTHKVRELFGGPRGCTHTTALIQAMAPVAVQCFWSMRASKARRSGVDAPFAGVEDESAQVAWRYNVGSCHVWDPDGELVALVEGGGEIEVPLQIQRRMSELGRDPDEWRRTS
ncbi:MAG: DUF2889 domain-containing protein [Desertimonas sp.]